MKAAQALLVSLAALIGLSIGAQGQSRVQPDAASVHQNDPAIRALYDRLKTAVETRDVDGIMALYAPGDTLVAYDLVPPLQYKGWAAYRKDYQGFLAQYEGPLHIEYRDLHVFSDNDVGFIYGLERLTGKMKNGQAVDMWVRVTSGVVKMNGKWYIVHDHVSVPADFETGKALLDLKP